MLYFRNLIQQKDFIVIYIHCFLRKISIQALDSNDLLVFYKAQKQTLKQTYFYQSSIILKHYLPSNMRVKWLLKSLLTTLKHSHLQSQMVPFYQMKVEDMF